MNKYLLFLFCAVLVSSTSQMLLKRGAQKKYDNILKEYLNPWVIFGYGLMVLSTLLVILAYRGVDYKNGAIIESLGLVLVMCFSRIFFGEKAGKKKLLGYGLILLGVVVFYL